jgi:hypothetical protein
VLLRDKPRHAVGHESVQVVEDHRRVAIAKVATPPHQEPVQILHDLLDRQQQPPTVGVLPDPLLGRPDRSLGRQRAQKYLPLRVKLATRR